MSSIPELLAATDSGKDHALELARMSNAEFTEHCNAIRQQLEKQAKDEEKRTSPEKDDVATGQSKAAACPDHTKGEKLTLKDAMARVANKDWTSRSSSPASPWKNR